MITVRLFAMLREAVGADTVEVALPSGRTVASLRLALARLHPAAGEVLSSRRVLTVVNGKYAEPGAPVSDGDEVAFLPPVSGG